MILLQDPSVRQWAELSLAEALGKETGGERERARARAGRARLYGPDSEAGPAAWTVSTL